MRGVGVQHVLDALHGGLASSRELLGRCVRAVRAWLRPYRWWLLVSRLPPCRCAGVARETGWPPGHGTALVHCWSVGSAASAPAELAALGGVDRVEALDRLVGDQSLTPVS